MRRMNSRRISRSRENSKRSETHYYLNLDKTRRSRESPDGTGKRVPRMRVSPSFLRVIKDAWDCKRWAPVLADEPANVSTEIFMMIVYGPYVY